MSLYTIKTKFVCINHFIMHKRIMVMYVVIGLRPSPVVIVKYFSIHSHIPSVIATPHAMYNVQMIIIHVITHLPIIYFTSS